MANKSDLQTILARHIGREKGISAQLLAALLDVEVRNVRKLVSGLREDGVAVCGHPTTGYYIAATPEELEETLGFLRSRAMHSLVLESRLRNLPLVELLGQLRIGS